MNAAIADAINSSSDHFITAKEASSYFAVRPKPDTVRKWMTKGIIGRGRRKNADGTPMTKEVIRLQCIYDGDTLLTTPAWIEEFKRACTERNKR